MGIQFLNLGDEARRQIQNWVSSGAFRAEDPAADRRFEYQIRKTEGEVSEIPAPVEDSSESLSEFDSVFPTEKNLPQAKTQARKKLIGGNAARLPSVPSSPLDAYDLPLVPPVVNSEQAPEYPSTVSGRKRRLAANYPKAPIKSSASTEHSWRRDQFPSPASDGGGV